MPLLNDPLAPLYNHAHELLRAHEVLLRDAVRNRAFYRALEISVNSDAVVLDIGAGTGIWAITAAKLGAKKVVAVEKDELLSGLIKMLAEEHEVAGRVEVVCGSSFDVQLEKEFNVIVSETVGYLGYDENIVEIMFDARQRFLKNGGSIIPETISLYAAGGHLKTEKEIIPNDLPFDFKILSEFNRHSPRTLQNKSDLELLTAPQLLIETDLSEATEQPALENLQAKWDVSNAGAINCFVVWVESRITGNVNLSTRQTTSWLPNLYRIEPSEADFSRIEFTLSLTAATNYWTATVSNAQTSHTQRLSPALAATRLTVRSRNADADLISCINNVQLPL